MKGTMRVLNRSGDTAVEWDTEDAQSVGEAERAFEALKLKGIVGFAVQTAEGKVADRPKTATKRLDNFDPEVEEIVMVPPIAGG